MPAGQGRGTRIEWLIRRSWSTGLVAPLFWAAALGPASPAMAACQLAQVGEIPITMQGSAPLVPVSINGHDLLLFLSTGNDLSHVSSSTAKALNIPVQPTRSWVGTTEGGEAQIGQILIKDFGFAGTTTHRILMNVIGSGRPDSDVAGVSFDAPEAATAVFPTVGIAQEMIRNARLRIADARATNVSSRIRQKTIEDPDLIVGRDFFMAHRIYLARGQKKMYFTYEGGPIFRLDEPGAAAHQ